MMCQRISPPRPAQHTAATYKIVEIHEGAENLTMKKEEGGGLGLLCSALFSLRSDQIRSITPSKPHAPRGWLQGNPNQG